MSELDGNIDKAKVAASLLLTAPGVPFLYYGEEIGLEGQKPDDDIRRPLQWSGDANAGFTSGSPWRAPVSDYTTKNIESQSADPDSLLSHYRRLIPIRNNHSALRVGDYYFIETVLIILNLGSKLIIDYALNLENGPLSGDYVLAPLLDNCQFTSPTITDQGSFEDYQPLPEIPPYGRFILQLQPEAQ